MNRLALVAVTCSTFCAAAASAATIYNDLAYDTASSRNVLDLYIPDDTTNAPLVMWIHGGAWQEGDKAGPTGLDAFLDAGVAVASMNHRYSTETPFTPGAITTNAWPAQLDDVRNAFAFLRDNGGTYGYDSSRLASFGFSSGAHLAAWAGLDLAGDDETRLRATVTWSAPTDLFNMDADDDADLAPGDFFEHSAAGSPESLLIGATVADNKDLADAASPTVYATTLATGAPLPSFLLMHGDQDRVVSSLQSQRLYDALFAQRGAERLELLILSGAGHGGDAFDERIPQVVNFISQEFGLIQLGDVNFDGDVNGLDVDPFVDVLLNGPYQPEADMNEDQVVNGLDVDPFVAAVVGGNVESISEPSTLVLGFLALAVVGGWRKWGG
jgi:acetyl esterase/lipase